MHQPRSYYNAFGSTTDASMQQLQCDLLPHVAEHQGRTDSILKRPQPHPPHRRYLEIAGSSHITWKNTRFGAPASSPKNKAMQQSCSYYNAFGSTTYTHPCRHYNAICIHTLQNSKREPIRPPKRPQPHPPHRGEPFHRRLQPLYTEKQGLCSGFLPKKQSHATIMQLLQCVWQHHLHIHAAIKPLHCDLHPRVAKHQGRTDSTPKRPQPHPPHRGEPFH